MKKFAVAHGRNAREPPPIGRPSLYTDRNIARVLAGLRSGITLTKLCQRPGMPSRRVVYDWTRQYPDFKEAFRAAKWTGYVLLFTAVVDSFDDMLDAGMAPEVAWSIFAFKAERFNHPRYLRAALAAPNSPSWPREPAQSAQ